MKNKILAIVVLGSVLSYSNNFLSIITKAHNKYDIKLPYTEDVSYSNWAFVNYHSCIAEVKNGNMSDDYYFEKIFQQDQFCSENQTRQATITRTYEDGEIEVVIKDEYRDIHNVYVQNDAVGSHIENHCLNILNFDSTLPDGEYFISHNGGMHVQCNMTIDGGGWTEIHREDTIFNQTASVINIDDKDFNYSSGLFTDNNSQSDFSTPFNDGRYDWNGYHAGWNAIKINGIWYNAEVGTLPTDIANKLPLSYFSGIQSANICNGNNAPENNCFKVMKFNFSTGHKIEGITDTQSITGTAMSNNYFHNNFSFYVR